MAPVKRVPWEEIFWTPERIWEGKTAFLLAGGDSLRTFDVERLRGRLVVAINQSIDRAPWADAVFFTDSGWFEKNRETLENFQGHILTLSRTAKREMNERVKRLEIENFEDFPPPGTRAIKAGRSSGHTAISVTVSMGAKTIILLGYDMRIVNGRSHHHNAYGTQSPELYSHDFIPKFAGWNAAAQRAGVTILNATPGSALAEFPIVDIEDILAERVAA